MMTLKKERKHGLYHRLWVYILIALIPFCFVAGLIVSGAIVGAKYKDSQENLWASFSYGIDNDCLRADYQGASTKITQKNAELIYSTISSSRYVFYKKEILSDADIRISFGNGDKLYLYTHDNVTMLIRYVRSDGDENIFKTKEITRLITFERLISIGRGNIPIDE